MAKTTDQNKAEKAYEEATAPAWKAYGEARAQAEKAYGEKGEK